MAGVLQFTLGLATGGFLGSLAAVDSRLKTFIGGMVSFGVVTEGVWRQIERGAALKQLSDQTGETVGNIYRLQQGLKAVGLDAGNAGTLLYQLNRSLGGVSESGEPTAYVFSQLGLSIEQLKKMDGPAALGAIAERLGKLDNAGATAAAGKIFGRFSAKEFLELARNTDAFSRALKGGAIQAAIFQRYAETFHNIEVGVKRVKEKANDLFLGIAAGIAPALSNVVAMLDGIDLSHIGADLGTIVAAFTQAFKEGKLSEMIADSLKLGFDSLLIFAPAVFEKIGYFLLKAFETPIQYFQVAFEWVGEQMSEKIAQLLSKIPGADKFVKTDYKAQTWDQLMDEAKKDGALFGVPGAGNFGAKDVDADVQQRWEEAKGKWQAAAKPWWDEVNAFATQATKGLNGTKEAKKTQETLGAAYKVERTSLEKMGFVFRGGAGAGDPARETAKNTRETAAAVRFIANQMTGGGAALALTNGHA